MQTEFTFQELTWDLIRVFSHSYNTSLHSKAKKSFVTDGWDKTLLFQLLSQILKRPMKSNLKLNTVSFYL